MRPLRGLVWGFLCNLTNNAILRAQAARTKENTGASLVSVFPVATGITLPLCRIQDKKKLDTTASRRHNSVHAQVFHHLAVLVGGMDDGCRSDGQAGRWAAED